MLGMRRVPPLEWNGQPAHFRRVIVNADEKTVDGKKVICISRLRMHLDSWVILNSGVCVDARVVFTNPDVMEWRAEGATTVHGPFSRRFYYTERFCLEFDLAMSLKYSSNTSLS